MMENYITDLTSFVHRKKRLCNWNSELRKPRRFQGFPGTVGGDIFVN
jgi:Cys-tRNA synthase (O-phospho-L-seryl-tRNA:Cys-tRNA synthase)